MIENLISVAGLVGLTVAGFVLGYTVKTQEFECERIKNLHQEISGLQAIHMSLKEISNGTLVVRKPKPFQFGKTHRLISGGYLCLPKLGKVMALKSRKRVGTKGTYVNAVVTCPRCLKIIKNRGYTTEITRRKTWDTIKKN